MSKFKPFTDRVKFTPIFEEAVKSSVIDTSVSEKILTGGIVIEVGDSSTLKIGDHIKFKTKAATIITEDDVQVGYIIESNIDATLNV